MVNGIGFVISEEEDLALGSGPRLEYSWGLSSCGQKFYYS